jgi:integrase
MASRKPIKTELQLSKLKPERNSYDVAVATAPGMTVRVSPRGRKSFRWDRGRGHSPRIVTYGSYPGISLTDVSKQHEKTRQRHEDGVDVAYGVEVPKTVSELAEAFYSERIVPHRKRPENVRRTLDTDIIPILGRMRLRSVSTPAVRTMVRKVVERGSPVQAGKVLAHCKQLFRFGVSIGVLESNPAESLDGMIMGTQDNVRDRMLTGEEIRKLYIALEQYQRLSQSIKVALRLLLLTGLRSGELRQAKWADVDLDNATLTVPVANQKLSPKQAKNAKPFVCTLSTQAVDQLNLMVGIDPIWVFPGRENSEFGASSPLTDKTFGRAVRRLLSKPGLDGELLLPIEPFSPHDLRRSLRSGLSRLGIAPHIAERCLNHSLGRIMATYDQHDYLEERRNALQRWADQVELYVGRPHNVHILNAGAM